jgi:O-antigen ligase
MINTLSIHNILFVGSLIISLFVFKIVIVPPAYVPLYILALILLFKNLKNYKFNKYALKILVFIIIYFFYSLVITTDFKSTVIYFFMWILNILVLNSICQYVNLNKFANYYTNIILAIAIISVLLFIVGVNDSTHFYGTKLDKNFLVFVYAPAIFFSLKEKKIKSFVVLMIAAILLYSRTFYVMVIIFVIFNFILNISFRVILKAFFVSFLASLIILFYSFDDLFLYQRLINGLDLAFGFFDVIFNSANYELIASQLGDKRRFLHMISNIEIMKSTFPFGTGMGLENYLSHIPGDMLSALSNRPARAHNFYISYLAEMGLLFFVFFLILIKPLFENKSKFIKPFFLSLLAGLAFNEFITTPFFWMAIGIINKDIYEPK